MRNKIAHYCSIKDGVVILDGKELFQDTTSVDFSEFIKKVYKHFELNYPKFYKMDSLSKLATATSSILLDSLENSDPEMALLLSNKSSCIDIDRVHQATISQGEDSYASPANFVYTLPNIALGEISIKYKLKSENSFFIFEEFNPDFLIDYANSLLQLEKAKSVLCGWVDVHDSEYNALIFIVQSTGTMELTKENLINLM